MGSDKQVSIYAYKSRFEYMCIFRLDAETADDPMKFGSDRIKVNQVC